MKESWPLMNADERGLKTEFLSVFIGVHRRPEWIFLNFPRIGGRGKEDWCF
jgi:hypothetical protein